MPTHIHIQKELLMEKKIAIVGQGQVGKTDLQLLNDRSIENELITIDPNVFYVNGVAYEPRQEEYRFGGRNRGRMASLIAIAEALGGLGSMDFGKGYTRKLSPDIDIIQEFALIQHKKSKLSRRERDAVVRTFNNSYTIVKQ